MKVAVAQLDASKNSSEENVDKVVSFIQKAVDCSCTLVLFPELITSGYYLDTIKDNALTLDSPLFESIQHTVKASDITVLVGIALNTSTETNNCLVLFSSNERRIVYSKTHLFPGEAIHFSFGNSYSTFQLNSCNVAPLICYDLRFSDPFILYRSMEANLFTISAAWPMARKNHWISLLKARAIETQSFIIASNRCGIDDGLEMAGNSMIISPLGEILALATDADEELISCDIDLKRAQEIREQYPFFDDRRPDIYTNNN